MSDVTRYWLHPNDLMDNRKSIYFDNIEATEVVLASDHDAVVRGLSDNIKGLVQFYDKHVGTPCEQIRHQQEVQELREQLGDREVMKLQLIAATKRYEQAEQRVAELEAESAADTKAQVLQGQVRDLTATVTLQRGLLHTAMDVLVELTSDRVGYDAKARARCLANNIETALREMEAS